MIVNCGARCALESGPQDRNWLSERAARKKGLVSIVVILPEATDKLTSQKHEARG